MRSPAPSLRSDSYVDKPLINRVHSGEFFGDGGVVLAMLWGTASLVLVVSGIIICSAMGRRSATGLQRLFW